MKQKNPPAVKSATRALEVLEFVASAEHPPSFAEIGEGLSIPNSSLFYLLGTLRQRKYLELSDNRAGYTLGTALADLAHASSAPPSYVEYVVPLVEQVWNKVQETTSYMERRGDEVECLISKLAPHSLLPVHRVGQRAPLYVFSGGKICLAELTEEELDAYLRRTSLKAFTPKTLVTPSAIRREIEQVRQTGVGTSREEHSLGIIGISIGLRTHAALVGTLGIAIPAVRFSESVLNRIQVELRGAARRFRAASQDK